MKTNSCSAAARLEPLRPSSVLYSRKALVRQQKANWIGSLGKLGQPTLLPHRQGSQNAYPCTPACKVKLKLNFANMLDICFPKYWNAEDGRFEHYWGLLQKYALYGTHNSVPALLQHMVGWKQLQGVVSSVLLNFIPIPLPVASIPLRIAMSGGKGGGSEYAEWTAELCCQQEHNQSAYPQICSRRG